MIYLVAGWQTPKILKSKNNQLQTLLFHIYVSIILCVYGYICHSTPGEVKGQLARVALSFHYVGSGDQVPLAAQPSHQLQGRKLT